MAKNIKLSEDTELNGVVYKAGSELSVSESIYDRLDVEGKLAPLSEKPKKSDKE